MLKKKLINKIAIIISWPREIDMYSKFLDLGDNPTFEFIVNDIKSSEKGRNQSNKLIEDLLIAKKIKFKLFSEVYQKLLYEKVISTGETCAEYKNLYSVIKHIYAVTIGFVLEFSKISKILTKFFGKPFTANGLKSKIGIDWYPEKKIGKISIKFPDGADVKLKNYPYSAYEDIFDVFLCYNDLEISLIQKKFKKTVCKKIEYFKLSELKEENKKKIDLIKEFQLDPKKPTIIWMPTHMLHTTEEDMNIFDWCEEISFLNKFYNFIIRPHPKTLFRNNSVLENLKKYEFKIDTNHNRSIKDMILSADLIFADYGGIIFDSIYLHKKVVLLDMFDGSEFVKDLKDSNSLDIKVRQNLLCMKIGMTKNQILSNIKSALSDKYQQTINENKSIYFGKDKGLNFNQLISFLKNL
jgi:hypothetical protein